MPIKEPIDKVGGSTFDEPHDLWQTHEPSFLIPKGREKQMRMCGHHHHCVQIDSYAALPQATLEDQLPGLGRKLPPFKCPECYENRTIILEYVRECTSIGVLAIKIHLYWINHREEPISDVGHDRLGRLRSRN